MFLWSLPLLPPPRLRHHFASTSQSLPLTGISCHHWSRDNDEDQCATEEDGRGWWYMGRARLWVVLWRPMELDSVRDCGINEYYDLYCCVFASFLGIRIRWWRVTLAGIWHSCSYSLLVFQHWFYRQDLCHCLILIMLSVSSHIAYWTADNDVGDGNRRFVLLYLYHMPLGDEWRREVAWRTVATTALNMKLRISVSELLI